MSIRKPYKKILEENKRLEKEKKKQIEENKRLLADIKTLVQKEFSPDRVFVESKWRKHFNKEETFKKLWKEIQPRRYPEN